MFLPCAYMISMKSNCVLVKTEYGIHFLLSLTALHEIVAGNSWSYIFIYTEWAKTYLTSFVKYCGNIQSLTNRKALYVPNKPDHMAVQDGSDSQDLSQGHRRLSLRSNFMNSQQMLWSKESKHNFKPKHQEESKRLSWKQYLCVSSQLR
jgi:hypothetical protein